MTQPPVPPMPPPNPHPQPQLATSGDTTMGYVAHFGPLSMLIGIPGVVPALIAYLVGKDDPLSGPHAKAALNFHLLWTIVGAAGALLTIVTFGLGLLIAFPVSITGVVLYLMGAVHASSALLLLFAASGIVFYIMGAVRGTQALGRRSPDVSYPLTPQFIK